MFRRNAVRNTNEDYCPVLHTCQQQKENQTDALSEADKRREETRGELFVLAANIYFRARRTTRARAAGII
jgi:hypothetical protein